MGDFDDDGHLVDRVLASVANAGLRLPLPTFPTSEQRAVEVSVIAIRAIRVKLADGGDATISTTFLTVPQSIRRMIHGVALGRGIQGHATGPETFRHSAGIGFPELSRR